MLTNRNLIVFSDDWERYPSTLQHIGKVLAKNNKIYWVGSLGLRKPRINKKDLLRIIEKFKSFFSNEKNIPGPQVIKLSIIVIPMHDWGIIRIFNAFLLLVQLKHALKKYAITNPIIFTSSPVMESLIGKLGETSSHYFCLDDWTQFDGTFEIMEQLEKSLLKKVDSCFSVSLSLQNSRIPDSGKSYFLPQGTDIEHFSKSNSTNISPLKNLPKPIIGFFGLLAPWLDLDLIKLSALRYPDFSFVLIGKSELNLESLRQFNNIFYVGEIKYNKLPSYAKDFNVGLIPFKINELTIAANPLKLLEYFSLGIPVVSTDLPEVRKFNECVEVAKSDQEFVELVGVAIRDKSSDSLSLKRKAIAEKYSWTSISESLSSSILTIEKKTNI